MNLYVCLNRLGCDKVYGAAPKKTSKRKRHETTEADKGKPYIYTHTHTHTHTRARARMQIDQRIITLVCLEFVFYSRNMDMFFSMSYYLSAYVVCLSLPVCLSLSFSLFFPRVSLT